MGNFRISGWGSSEELRKTQEIEIEWELSGGSKMVTSDGQIDQLDAFRFKTQMESKTLLREREKREILENEMHGMRKEMPKEETYSKYCDSDRRLESGKLEGVVTFCEFHMRIYLVANP